MFNRVKKFYKRQKVKLARIDHDYDGFVDAEETMEFGMEPTPGQVDERIAFGSMAKGQKRYGSTSTRLKRDDAQGFPYTVQTGDTLQGIAVKFGVTTEQIRRTNQLWTNDSLFLRDKLIIPIPMENGNSDEQSSSSFLSPISSASERRSTKTNTNGSSTSSQCQIHTFPTGLTSPQEVNFTSPSTLSTGSKHWTHPLSDSFEYDEGLMSPDSIKLDSDSLSTPNSVIGETLFETPKVNENNCYQNGGVEAQRSHSSNGTHTDGGENDPSSPRRYMVKDHSEKSVNDFLSRIDLAIASSRRKTQPLLNNQSKQWVTFESDSESEQHFQRAQGTSLSAEGRHLRQSLRKLEKKQDELFQL